MNGCRGEKNEQIPDSMELASEKAEISIGKI